MTLTATSAPVVSIGCKLPNGFNIEVNATRDAKGVISDKYRSVYLAGKGAITAVPADVWDLWLRANAKLRYVRDGSIYRVQKNGTS